MGPLELLVHRALGREHLSGNPSPPGRLGVLPDALRFDNPPEHIGLQYWAYEEKSWTSTGRALTWEPSEPSATGAAIGRCSGGCGRRLRHRTPERVLVIVGFGHKYFLDELTREAGYRWVDPREWLPESCTADEDLKANERTTK